MHAVWMVRARQIARKLSWWLALIGYNPRDRSLINRIYLVYAGIFFAIWFFAVFSLLAGATADILHALSDSPTNQTATGLAILALLSWALYQLWQATRCSPLIFSEEDAHLICQAPVPGSAVTIAWFLGNWFEPAAPFWAGAVTLGFALVESRLEHQVSALDIPAYVASGLQALIVIALVQLGMMAMVWAAGALRLQRDRQLTWQPRAVRAGIIILGLALAFSLVSHGLNALNYPLWQVILSPLRFPLSGAFGIMPWLFGLLGGFAWVGLGLAALAWAGADLNLSRAAQETTQKEKLANALRYGQSELVNKVALSNKLGDERAPSRLPFRAGWWMLGWKDMLQSSRTLGFSNAWNWISLIAVYLAVCFVPDPGARMLALAIWSVMVGQRVTSRLQQDLANWSLLRMLPFSSNNLLLAEMALPWIWVVLLGWGALGLASAAWTISTRLAAAMLLPGLSAAISFATAFDLLRQARSDMLLNGITPSAGSVGGMLGILCVALPLGLWLWLNHAGLHGVIPAMALAVFLAWLFWQLAGERLRRGD